MVEAVAGTERWELYKLLSEPSRLRLLALAAEEELSIGELAELLAEAQPNVSRHLKPLRTSGLLAVRKQGTRVLVRLAEGVGADPVVADALRSGRALCAGDGSLARVPLVVAARDADARAFFDRPQSADPAGFASELPAYLTALGALLPRRRLAVDVGTGHGHLIDVLAPVFERVVAVDRSSAQLDRAAARLAVRGYRNVELLEAEFGDRTVHERVRDLGGADAVFASRVLHHAPQPATALNALASLAAEGGTVVVIDYRAHDDERLRDLQADLWLGFEPAELRRLALQAGLLEPATLDIPAPRCGEGPDGHLDWQVLVARRPADHALRRKEPKP